VYDDQGAAPGEQPLITFKDIVILSMAVLFTLLGWRRVSGRPYRRSYYDDRPPGVSRGDYDRQWWRRKRAARVSLIVLWGIAGALIGIAFTKFLKKWFPGS
jgi:hypothetical protein